jgi:hypothetical protein
MFRAAAVTVGLVGLALSVAGCGQVVAAPTKTSQPSAASPSATLPSATTSATTRAMTPAEAKAAYKAIAKTSCNLAQAQGVAEVGPGTTAIMTNRAQGYKDFTAAYFEAPDAYSIIWELDGFNACRDWYSFSMADEAGKEAAIDVVFNTNDASFTVKQDLGQFGASAVRVVVADGLIATVTDLNPQTPGIVGLRYGSLTNADLNILKTAVDRYLATLN